MKMKKRCFAFCALTLVFIFVLSGCKADFVGNKIKAGNKYTLSFSVLNRTEKETLSLKKGQELKVMLALEEGTLSFEIGQKDKAAIYKGTDLESAEFSVSVPESGSYTISVTGKGAKGAARLEVN